MPYLEQIHFPISSAGNEPTRYQMLSLDLRNLALVPALAIRFGNDLRIGLAPGFLFSTGTLDFAEDTALDSSRTARGGGTRARTRRQPRGARRVRPRSGRRQVSLDPGRGHLLAAAHFEFGLSYQSRPLGSPQSGVEVAGQQSTVTLPPRVRTGRSPAGTGTPPAVCSRTPPTGCPTW